MKVTVICYADWHVAANAPEKRVYICDRKTLFDDDNQAEAADLVDELNLEWMIDAMLMY